MRERERVKDRREAGWVAAEDGWAGCAWTREIREIMVVRIRALLVHTRPHAPRETDHRTVPMGPARHSGGNSLDNNHLLFLNGVDAVPEVG